MSALPSHVDPEIYGKVASCFAEALGLDDDEVTYDAKVIDDLGAESLDLLDIAFRLERTFDIKIPRGGIEQAAQQAVDEDQPYEVDGVLTPRGLEALAEAMPEVPREEFREGLKVSEVGMLFRVATFYRLVVELLAKKSRPDG